MCCGHMLSVPLSRLRLCWHGRCILPRRPRAGAGTRLLGIAVGGAAVMMSPAATLATQTLLVRGSPQRHRCSTLLHACVRQACAAALPLARRLAHHSRPGPRCAGAADAQHAGLLRRPAAARAAVAAPRSAPGGLVRARSPACLDGRAYQTTPGEYTGRGAPHRWGQQQRWGPLGEGTGARQGGRVKAAGNRHH